MPFLLSSLLTVGAHGPAVGAATGQGAGAEAKASKALTHLQRAVLETVAGDATPKVDATLRKSPVARGPETGTVVDASARPLLGAAPRVQGGTRRLYRLLAQSILQPLSNHLAERQGCCATYRRLILFQTVLWCCSGPYQIGPPMRFISQLFRHRTPIDIPADVGAAGALSIASSTLHPCSAAPPMHPLYERALECTTRLGGQLKIQRLVRFAFWEALAARSRPQRSSWLRTLPSHCQRLYGHSGLHGPLLEHMHAYLVSLGFTDKDLFTHVSQGLPSGRVLPCTGLWPPDPKYDQKLAARASTRDAFERAPKRIEE